MFNILHNVNIESMGTYWAYNINHHQERTHHHIEVAQEKEWLISISDFPKLYSLYTLFIELNGIKKKGKKKDIWSYAYCSCQTLERHWKLLLQETLAVLHFSGSQTQHALSFFITACIRKYKNKQKKKEFSIQNSSRYSSMNHDALLEQMEKAEKVLLCNIKCDWRLYSSSYAFRRFVTLPGEIYTAYSELLLMSSTCQNRYLSSTSQSVAKWQIRMSE